MFSIVWNYLNMSILLLDRLFDYFLDLAVFE